MKLTKAIEILDLNIKEQGGKMPPDCLTALKLAVSALEQLTHYREVDNTLSNHLLHGETLD